MLFAFIHELGHIMAGVLLKFKPNSLEIMPVGISVGFESKLEDYDKKIKKGTRLTIKKLIIALAGPFTNLIFVIIFLLFPVSFFGIERQLVIYANTLIGIFNLIPIYPLDGGRIVKNFLHIYLGRKKSFLYSNKISNITIAILTAISSISVLYLKNIAILLILAYLWYLVVIENKKYRNREKMYLRFEKIVKENAVEMVK